MRATVLLVDNNEDVASVVTEVLREEGFTVCSLATVQVETVQHAVLRIEPDLVLLDGEGAAGYGQSWRTAAWLHARMRPIPAIMFTAHAADLAEAQSSETPRSQHAAFAEVISKPFDLGALIAAVSRALQEANALSGQAYALIDGQASEQQSQVLGSLHGRS
jgi:CheY-like chemotaxis protein